VPKQPAAPVVRPGVDPATLGEDVLRIEYFPLSEVTRWPRNPKRHDVDTLRASFQRWGFVEPMVRDDRTGRLVAGHGRLEVLTALRLGGKPPPARVKVRDDGEWLVPILVGASFSSELEAEGYLLASNRLVELGGWDDAGVLEILTAQRDAGLELTGTGYTEDDADELMREALRAAGGGSSGGTDTLDEERFDLPAQPRSVPGEVYTLGRHRLMCGDSTKPDDVAKLLEGGQVDLVFTDPPYAIYGSSTGVESDVADDKMIRPMFREILAAISRSTRTFGHVYVCCDWRSWASWWEMSKGTLVVPKNMVVWDKGGAGLGGMYANTHELILFASVKPKAQRMGDKITGERMVSQSNVWHISRVGSGEKEHNAQKPIDLVRRAMQNSSDPGGRVLDLFGGSGTTLMAAELEGRSAYLMEMEPRWCDVIRDRYERLVLKSAAPAGG
jgi:DNA modification methylase